jgi:hypothetical protein
MVKYCAWCGIKIFTSKHSELSLWILEMLFPSFYKGKKRSTSKVATINNSGLQIQKLFLGKGSF